MADVAAARRQAVEEIRSLVGEEAKQGRIDLRGRIEMEGEAGELLGIILFSEAVDLKTGPLRQ